MKKSFNEKCYEILRKVPKGKVTTYKALAHAMNTKAYRAVGNAMNKNPYAYAQTNNNDKRIISARQKFLVACHRVVGSDGSMTGFASGIKNKVKMLKAEGIEVKNNKVDLKKYEYKF